MGDHHLSVFRKIPFLKLFIAFVSGIIIHWYLSPKLEIWWITLSVAIIVLFILFAFPLFKRFKLIYIAGVCSFLIFSALGGILTYLEDPRNQKQWIGNKYLPGDVMVITLNGPPTEKNKTIRFNASADLLLRNGKPLQTECRMIVYFRKPISPDSILTGIEWGTRFLIRKPPQKIRNSGNPGGFDYKQYCLFRGITHQIYLEKKEIELLSPGNKNSFAVFIDEIRKKVLAVLRKHIGDEKALGLAEALLIGYKDDLDKELVRSYANTGVVHIIAISGLHIGLIYWLLVQLLKPIRKIKRLKWITPVIIISGLWLFSILAGAQPSILRSALMFTCIVIGENLSRRSSIYNTLAVSAFILLCINPFWLWDIGFQLSYAAVLSIIIFMRPIYNWFYIKNKIIDHIWKLNAVTLAAQVFTIPLCIYHFHQFPNYFLLSNLLAVPLSGFILFGEILLCMISFVPAAAIALGKILSVLIKFMNSYIEWIEQMPFSVSNGLLISIPQVILLFIVAAGSGYWLLERSKTGLRVSLATLLLFFILRMQSFYQTRSQKKIIVYSIPGSSGIDFIRGSKYQFIGDSNINESNLVADFQLKPSRIINRVGPENNILFKKENYFQFDDTRILLINDNITFQNAKPKPIIDILIMSKNPRIYLSRLAATLDIKQVVIDASVPAWRSTYWKRDCDSLKIPCHDVSVNGAFVMTLR